MKKISIILLLTLFIIQCSFDNKTGIWKNSNYEIVDKADSRFKDFETLYTKDKTFDAIISPKKNLLVKVEPIKKNMIWDDEFYNNTNNFSYQNNNEIIFKSKKLSRNKINKNFLFDKKNIVLADSKGFIIIYSIKEQKIIYKYNFYKKKFKKIKKKLNIIVEKNIIYVSDNMGYLYALDYVKKKIIWAHDYKIPFRSNIKIIDDKILLANQNNLLFFVSKFNGKRFKKMPTEETILKSEFINSLESKNNLFYFLNTYGSLYSLNATRSSINWFINLNQSTNLDASNLFYSNSLILHKNRIIVSTDPYLYILDQSNGAIILKKNITSIIKPIVSGQYLFLITKDNLLVCINASTGKVLYSLKINQEIANFLETKKRSIYINSLSLINNNLYVFLKNSYVVKFSVNGKITDTVKFKSKISSTPIFIDNNILYLNKKNQLIILN